MKINIVKMSTFIQLVELNNVKMNLKEHIWNMKGDVGEGLLQFF